MPVIGHQRIAQVLSELNNQIEANLIDFGE